MNKQKIRLFYYDTNYSNTRKMPGHNDRQFQIANLNWWATELFL